MAGKDSHDRFVIDTSQGGKYELVIHAMDELPMYVEVFELDGTQLLHESVEGHETLRRALAVRPGVQVYVTLDGHGNGRYELSVIPAASVASAR